MEMSIKLKKESSNYSLNTSNSQLWLSIILIVIGLHLCAGLTSESRSELARKFKYYHRSVRPGDRFNLIDTINGTFFALHTEVELLQTRPIDGKLEIELMLSLYYNEERLILRDLQEVITIPEEFTPWIPQLEFTDGTTIKSSIHLDPKTGQISVRSRLHLLASCKNLEWTAPFQVNHCKFEVGTDDNEKIFPRIIRDLRTESDVFHVDCSVEQFPTFSLLCQYRNQWLFIVVNTYLPSFLIFTVAVFAQWKRRKLQVLVTLGGLIGLILLKTAKDRDNNFTMEDLWLLATLIHMVALLGIDLVLSARRIIRTTYTRINDKVNPTPISNHATYSNRSTEKIPITTASYKDATHRFLRSFAQSSKTMLATAEECSVYLDIQPKLPPVHYDLSDIEMADEEGDEDDADLQRMRTTYVQIRRPIQQQSPSINERSQKPTSSLSTSATNVTSPTTTAILRRRASESPTTRSQHLVTKMTIGRKKRFALISIIGCYLVFLFAYVTLVIYILN